MDSEEIRQRVPNKCQQNGSASQAGRYNKSLLPMNDALITFIKSTLIRKFYTNTQQGIEGTMMLPSANYLNFMTGLERKLIGNRL